MKVFLQLAVMAAGFTTMVAGAPLQPSETEVTTLDSAAFEPDHYNSAGPVAFGVTTPVSVAFSAATTTQRSSPWNIIEKDVNNVAAAKSNKYTGFSNARITRGPPLQEANSWIARAVPTDGPSPVNAGDDSGDADVEESPTTVNRGKVPGEWGPCGFWHNCKDPHNTAHPFLTLITSAAPKVEETPVPSFELPSPIKEGRNLVDKRVPPPDVLEQLCNKGYLKFCTAVPTNTVLDKRVPPPDVVDKMVELCLEGNSKYCDALPDNHMEKRAPPPEIIDEMTELCDRGFTKYCDAKRFQSPPA
ncbi:hypothetical protein MBLNU230_g7559t1 [Neophaeotheca triangularis]